MFDFAQNSLHTFFMLWWLVLSVSFADPAPAPRLSCLLDKQEVCADAEFKVRAVAPDEFAKLYDGRKEKFIDWIKPAALFVQGATGLPASVLIAQAAIASEWGTTPAFRTMNNIFKQACWQAGAAVSGEFELLGRKFSYKGVCQKEKAIGQVGKLIKFPTRQDSLLAYLHFTVVLNTRYSKALLEDLRHGVRMTPPRGSSFRSASPLLSYFAIDNSYVSGLQRVIQSEKISTLDNMACWECFVIAARPPAPPAAAPAPAASPAPAPGGGH